MSCLGLGSVSPGEKCGTSVLDETLPLRPPAHFQLSICHFGDFPKKLCHQTDGRRLAGVFICWESLFSRGCEICHHTDIMSAPTSSCQRDELRSRVSDLMSMLCLSQRTGSRPCCGQRNNRTPTCAARCWTAGPKSTPPTTPAGTNAPRDLRPVDQQQRRRIKDTGVVCVSVLQDSLDAGQRVRRRVGRGSVASARSRPLCRGLTRPQCGTLRQRVGQTGGHERSCCRPEETADPR